MIPQNESGVIVCFAQGIANESSIDFVSIQTDFPDAVIKVNEVKYKVEFEYLASNFIIHDHDPRGCDLIMCWENDRADEIPLPIIELCNSEWVAQCFDIQLATDDQKTAFYWQRRALKAERRLHESDRPSLDSKDRSEAILSAFATQDSLNVTRLAKQLDTSRSTLYRDISRLVDEGRLYKNGEGWKVNV